MDLFPDDEGKRAALVAAGWRQVGGYLHGRMMWRPPGSESLYSEEQAIRIHEGAQGKEGGQDAGRTAGGPAQ